MNYGGASYGQPQTRSKVVFVGNLPFDYTEEQFIEVFSSVGPVVSFRLVFDHATGKPKGFGFCEYRDADTAASALRNLQGVEVGGRGLRLDFADTDDAPPSKRARGGFGGGMGAGGPPAGGYGGAMGGGMGGGPAPGPGPSMMGGAMGGGAGGNVQPRPLPAGVTLEPGKSATDKISETIGTMAPGQLLDIMSQMKALVIASPYEARALLTANPQLSYALFQAMLCMGIVDPALLQKAFPGAYPAAPPTAPAPTPASYPPQPSYGGAVPPYNAPPSSYGTPPPPAAVAPGAAPYANPNAYNRPPQQQAPLSYKGPAQPGYGHYQGGPKPPPQSYNGPAQQPPMPAASAPPAAAPAPSATPDQAALIQQVLAMTDAQIASLDETSRNTILQIRQQAQRAMGR
ncbi:hypothetical protein JCM21900_003279 [Sporobolomyces salmonicolor]